MDRPIVSNAIYRSEYEKLLKASNQTTNNPGSNYTFLSEHYPVPEHLPDLEAQIGQFLASPPPQNPPKETVFVISFGAWDIWHLSALPREIGDLVLDATMHHLKAQMEVLFQKSMDEDSPAFSDFWSYANETLIERIRRSKELPGFGIQPHENDAMRVLLPRLMDPTLTPGWEALRPVAPEPHSEAEQLRNAVHLVEEWNRQTLDRMEEWMQTQDIVSLSADDVEVGEGTPKQKRANTRPKLEDDLLTAPLPRRLAAYHDIPNPLMTAILEQQLRQHNVIDTLGLGSQPLNHTLYFKDVHSPCYWGSAPRQSATTESDGRVFARSLDQRSLPCQIPGDHLFYTPFTVGDRATKEIARRAASLVDLYLDVEPRELIERN
jgi:hypothetical protein